MSQALNSKGVRWGWIISGLAIVVLAAGFLVKGIEGNIQYYMTASEYREMQPKYVGKKVKIAGKVSMGSLKTEGQSHRFVVEDLGKTVTVHYRGLAPDTFKEGAEVVVEGYGTPGDEFEAKTLMAKCASKYEPGGQPPLEKMRGKSVY